MRSEVSGKRLEGRETVSSSVQRWSHAAHPSPLAPYLGPFLTFAPVRISFGGGGTDLAAYYRAHGGMVVSAAITRYCQVQVRPRGDGFITISSQEYGVAEQHRVGELPPAEGALALPRAALGWAAEYGLLAGGCDLALASAVPAGSGLGASSAMAVGLVRALAAQGGRELSAAEVAEAASQIEIERLGQPIGRQDQYASAFGGLNVITFNAEGVRVTPLGLDREVAAALSERLLLFWTGQARESASILRQQQADSGGRAAVIESLHRIKALAGEMYELLLAADLDGFGRLLDRGWQEKRRLSERISSPAIDGWYAAARQAGALGGKVAGAGGGGFLLLYCPPERQTCLRAAMGRCGLRELTFDFDYEGARVEQATSDRGRI